MHNGSDHGYSPTTYCGDCGKPWHGAHPEYGHGCCFGFVSEATQDHERAVMDYQRQVYPKCMKFKRPYDWRERVRYEVAHDITTTQSIHL